MCHAPVPVCVVAEGRSDLSPSFPDRYARIHREPVQQAPVLLRRHPEDFFLRHGPVEPASVLVDPVIDKCKTVPFKSQGFQAVAPLPAEQEEGMFVICVKMELVLYDGSQLFDALSHISIIGKDPDVRVFM